MPSLKELRQINSAGSGEALDGVQGAGFGFDISAAPAQSTEAVGLLRARGTFTFCINLGN